MLKNSTIFEVLHYKIPQAIADLTYKAYKYEKIGKKAEAHKIYIKLRYIFAVKELFSNVFEDLTLINYDDWFAYEIVVKPDYLTEQQIEKIINCVISIGGLNNYAV